MADVLLVCVGDGHQRLLDHEHLGAAGVAWLDEKLVATPIFDRLELGLIEVNVVEIIHLPVGCAFQEFVASSVLSLV